MVYVFFATGFEEIEALAPVDIMRRAGLEVVTVSVTGKPAVTGTHGVPVVTDIQLSDVDWETADALVLPGGLPGATNLESCAPLCEALVEAEAQGKIVAAICAAPMVLGRLGLLRGRKATCYPGCEKALEGAHYTAAMVQTDDNIITGRGPAAAMEFGYTLVEALAGKDASAPLRDGMIYTQLMRR